VLAQEKRGHFLDQHRAQTIEKNQKWDDFRQRRAAAVDRYIKAKALQGTCEQMLGLAKCILRLADFAGHYQEVKVTKTKEAKEKFAIFRLESRWRKRKAACGGFDTMLRNYARYAFACSSPAKVEITERSVAIEYLEPFLREYQYREDLKRRFRRARGLLVFIQSRFLAQILMKKSKLEVLRMYWEKNLGQMRVAATRQKDKATQKLTVQLLGSDRGLVEEFLRRYLTQCKLKHSIAFF